MPKPDANPPPREPTHQLHNPGHGHLTREQINQLPDAEIIRLRFDELHAEAAAPVLRAKIAALSPDALEALAFYHPRRGFPSFTPAKVLAELEAVGLVLKRGRRHHMPPIVGSRAPLLAAHRRRPAWR